MKIGHLEQAVLRCLTTNFHKQIKSCMKEFFSTKAKNVIVQKGIEVGTIDLTMIYWMKIIGAMWMLKDLVKEND